jgi:hypothetical protein
MLQRKYTLLGILLFVSGMILGFFSAKYYEKRKIDKMEVVATLNNTGIPIENLKKSVIDHGDIQAYRNLHIEYLNVEFYEGEFLFYSIIMANKYNYPPANYYVYKCLTGLYEHDIRIGKIDSTTIGLALSYLRKGASLKEYNAINTLSQLYFEGRYVSKDTVLAEKLKNETKSISNLKIEK